MIEIRDIFYLSIGRTAYVIRIQGKNTTLRIGEDIMDSAGHLSKVTGVSGKTRCFGDADTWSITLENEAGIEEHSLE